MARIDADSLLRFSPGIDTFGRAETLRQLPDEGFAPALDTRPVQLLDALYEGPSADQQLLLELTPEISERSTITPAVYAEGLHDARERLSELAAQSGAAAAIFHDAIAVLGDAEETRAVYDTATRALMRA
jgi:hypothetical protein